LYIGVLGYIGIL